MTTGCCWAPRSRGVPLCFRASAGLVIGSRNAIDNPIHIVKVFRGPPVSFGDGVEESHDRECDPLGSDTLTRPSWSERADRMT